MKKISLIIGIILLMLLIGITTSFANNEEIAIDGEATVIKGQKGAVTVSISNSGSEIGLVEGKITVSGGIELTKVSSADSNWVLTYNSSEGIFNIYSAEGSNEADIITIEYMANNLGEASITLSGLKFTTIDYDDVLIEDEIFNVNVVNEGATPDPDKKTLTGIKVSTPPTKTTYNEGDKFDKSGMVVTASYSDGTSSPVTNYTFSPSSALKTTDTKITISYSEGGVTKTDDVLIKVIPKSGGGGATGNENGNGNGNGQQPSYRVIGNENLADKDYPETGIDSIIIPVILVIITAAVISYIKYKKYDEI